LTKNREDDDMAVKAKIIEGVGVIKVKGNLIGGDETTDIHEQVKRFVAEDVRNVVIDLQRVKWMNSHGLGMLMGCYSTVQSVHGRMALSRLTEKVKHLMEMTKVIKLFDIYDNVHQAVKALL
jgi:anti-sigma B factor antagonist